MIPVNSASRNLLYLCTSNTIEALNPDTLAGDYTITLGSTFNTPDMVLDDTGQIIYLALKTYNPHLYKIDISDNSGTLLQSLSSFDLGANLRQIALSPVDPAYIYIACAAPYRIQQWETATLTKTGGYDVGAYPAATAITNNGYYVMGANGSRYVQVFDKATEKFLLQLDYRRWQSVKRFKISPDDRWMGVLSEGETVFGDAHLYVLEMLF